MTTLETRRPAEVKVIDGETVPLGAEPPAMPTWLVVVLLLVFGGGFGGLIVSLALHP